MSRENKYLREFLNLLSDDQVFHSYLTNTFMLNQMNLLTRQVQSGERTQEEVEREMQGLIDSIEIMIPNPGGSSEINLTSEEFCNLVRSVKTQAIQNLSERRRN